MGSGADSIMLKAGEAVFAKVTNTSLIEERRGPGHYAGPLPGCLDPHRQLRWPVRPLPGWGQQGPLRLRDADTHGHRHRNHVHHEPAGDLPGRQADPRVRLRQADRVRARRQHRVDHVLRLQPPEADDDPLRAEHRWLVRLPAGPRPGPLQGDRRRTRRRTAGRASTRSTRTARQSQPRSFPRRPPAIAPAQAAPAAPTAPEAPVSTVNAGWYADPWKLATLRWWDGTQWTATSTAIHRQPLRGIVPPSHGR